MKGICTPEALYFAFFDVDRETLVTSQERILKSIEDRACLLTQQVPPVTPPPVDNRARMTIVLTDDGQTEISFMAALQDLARNFATRLPPGEMQRATRWFHEKCKQEYGNVP